MIYIKRGISVLYDEKNKKRYHEAMRSEKIFVEFVDKMVGMFEDARNMDW
jgi:hypothetical protein